MKPLLNFLMRHSLMTPVPTADSVSVHFFNVVAANAPDVEELKALIKSNKLGEFAEVDMFDHKEHGFIELGAWLGSQEYALRLMGLGAKLGIFELRTPENMMPGIDKKTASVMAGGGLVTVQMKKGA